LGADVINMSTVPEVSLANELGIEYATIAMSTDYDCWKENAEPVTFEMVIGTMKKNADNVKRLIVETIPNI
ncbi:MAG TPA: S-methyl-5'-thioadenosine phosphorylase, partial [Methanofastidiosum sp.]|nr:S-methyl-5'-thioadenosine phosphorylase [Methanofastidiosum sp.]